MNSERRYSRKREVILQELSCRKDHPSAEMLYACLKDTVPDLSLGTVYRNLSVFRKENKAVCAAVVNGQERYDGNVLPHAHFVCKKCGAVIDLEEDPESSFQFRFVNIPGEIHNCTITIYGVCDHCR